MLRCRQRQQQENSPLDHHHQSMGEDTHRGKVPSYRYSQVYATLILDWFTSHGHSRVFASTTDLETGDYLGALSSKAGAALVDSHGNAWPGCYRHFMAGRQFEVATQRVIHR